MRQIIKGINNIIITGKFGDKIKLKNWIISKRLNGINIRTWYPTLPIPTIIILPEKSILIHKKYYKKWGWKYIFKGLETEYDEIVFNCLSENKTLTTGTTYNQDTIIGVPFISGYMIKNLIGQHLYFETHKNNVIIDPVTYFDTIGVNYTYIRR